jgi:predicted SAM-dependent methyltransferase
MYSTTNLAGRGVETNFSVIAFVCVAHQKRRFSDLAIEFELCGHILQEARIGKNNGKKEICARILELNEGIKPTT